MFFESQPAEEKLSPDSEIRPAGKKTEEQRKANGKKQKMRNRREARNDRKHGPQEINSHRPHTQTAADAKESADRQGSVKDCGESTCYIAGIYSAILPMNFDIFFRRMTVATSVSTHRKCR